MILSILGMYSYDNTIFDGLSLPEGIEKNDVINEILAQCAELEILYPEPETLKILINIWSNSNQIKWQKLYDTMTVEYNPIWNVDGEVIDTETITGDRDITRTGSDNETVNLTDTRSVKGFNDTSWADAEKNTKTGTDNIAHNETVNEGTESTREYRQRRTGNIGVTMTQQLLEAERKVADFNLIEVIVNSFKYRFCILVY